MIIPVEFGMFLILTGGVLIFTSMLPFGRSRWDGVAFVIGIALILTPLILGVVDSVMMLGG